MPEAPSRTSLVPVALAFLLFGGFWGAWTVSTADIERSLRLGHAAFGALVSAGLVGGALANAAGGPLSEHWGTSRVLRWTLVTWGTVLIVAGAAARGAGFAVAMTVAISMAGAVDVVMNVAAAAALAERPGRLVRFHGLFNAGAAIGATGVGVLLHAGASWRWTWVVAGALAWVLALGTAGTALPAGEAGDRLPLGAGLRVVRNEGLVLVAAAFAVGAMVEGAISTWGVLFLRNQLSSGILVGTTAAAVGFAVAAAARIGLGPLAGAAGAARGVGIGAGLAAAGLLVLVTAGSAGPAAVGLAVAAMGISMCWPLLLARATEGRARPGVIVGGVSAIGYLGLVAGPAVVGGLSEGVGLRGALVVLVVASVFVAGAPSVPVRAQAAATGT